MLVVSGHDTVINGAGQQDAADDGAGINGDAGEFADFIDKDIEALRDTVGVERQVPPPKRQSASQSMPVIRCTKVMNT